MRLWIAALVATACSTAVPAQPDPDGPGGATSSGGTGGVLSGGAGGGDEPGAPEVAIEPCDNTFADANGTVQTFAEHEYPGASIEELASVSVILEHVVPPAFTPPGYTRVSGNPLIAAGKVAVLCGQESAPTYSQVMFVRP